MSYMVKTQRQAIIEFLETQDCKLDFYNPSMEVQVNVLAKGEVDTSNNNLVYWHEGYSYSNFRIPYGSYKNPHYSDNLITWPLKDYVEAIGCSGWDFETLVSRYVGFDFDSIANHVNGLTDGQLEELREKVASIPWVTLRRSKSGKGYHMYVDLEKPVKTANHTEHAGLAKAILSHLSALLEFDFVDRVDKAGGILWVWHKDADPSNGSFELLKQGEPLKEIPPNWRDFIGTRKASKGKNHDIIAQTKKIDLTDSHRAIIKWLSDNGYTCWWDAELNLMVTHTAALKIAHTALKLRGLYDTSSTGKNLPCDHNCFCFPLPNGGWRVYRFDEGTTESHYWSKHINGHSYIDFNVPPTLEMAAKVEKAVRTKKKTYILDGFNKVVNLLKHLGIKQMPISVWDDRDCEVGFGDAEGTIVAYVQRYTDENLVDSVKQDGWYSGKSKSRTWEKVFDYSQPLKQVDVPDHIVRHAVLGDNSEWHLHSQGYWSRKSTSDIKPALLALGYARGDLDDLLGQAVLSQWRIVSLPFASEYPGDRQWNKDSTQFAFKPNAGISNTWNSLLSHIGKNIPVKDNEWCRHNNVASGMQYLKLWVASLIKYPQEPLPYLFLTGEQEAGKSIFHEAISTLFTGGVIPADYSLTNNNGFNAELDGAVLCYVEEVDLSKSATALNRIKDWVTGRKLQIHPKGKTPYLVPNTTHWVQCANDTTYCPILPGDSRIVIIKVDKPVKSVPKPELLQTLKSEAPAFLDELINLEIPLSDSRLRIPVINSKLKEHVQSINQNPVLEFMSDYCEPIDGMIVKVSDFIDQFRLYYGKEASRLTNKQIKSQIDVTHYPIGTYGSGARQHIGNINLAGYGQRISGSKVTTDKKGKLE